MPVDATAVEAMGLCGMMLMLLGCLLRERQQLVQQLNDAITQQNRTNQLVRTMFDPTRDLQPPQDTPRKVYEALVQCAYDYAVNGVESHRAGHILVLGDAKCLIESGMGSIRGLNLYEFLPKETDNKHVCILNEFGKKQLKNEMNFDGAHVICEKNGRITACNFFSNVISQEDSTGNSGAAAAASLSQMAPVVLKISQDGKITEFRQGRRHKVFLGNMPRPCELHSLLPQVWGVQHSEFGVLV